MKKEKFYLVVSLAIIAVSGVIIYIYQSNNSLPADHRHTPQDQSEMTASLINQIAQYKKQLEVDPDNYSVLVNLGNSYFDLNNPAESVKYYERALKIKPDTPEVLVDCEFAFEAQALRGQAVGA